MKYRILILVIFLFFGSNILYTQNPKQAALDGYNQFKAVVDNYSKTCPEECKPLDKFLDEYLTMINSINVNAFYSEEQAQQILNKIYNMVSKYKPLFENCENCVLQHQNQKNHDGRPVQSEITHLNSTPNFLTPDPGLVAAERAAQLSNTIANAAAGLEGNAIDRQNKLQDIEARELGDKIQIQPKVPKEFHDQEKEYLENDMYGDIDTDKFDNNLGLGDEPTLDDLFGDDGDNDNDAVVAGTSGQQVLLSDTAMVVSWSYQFIETQNCPIMGNPDAKFNMYKITGTLKNISNRTLRSSVCCSEIRHFNTSTACGTPKSFASFSMQINPSEASEEIYYVWVPSGESVPQPQLNMGQYFVTGEDESKDNSDSNPNIIANSGQQTLYSDSTITILWEYRFLKTLTCGVPMEPEAKFNQYQVTATLFNRSSKQISFTECCTEVRHNHGNSGCGSTGGFGRFDMRIPAKSTNIETYNILIPVGTKVPDPEISVSGYTN